MAGRDDEIESVAHDAIHGEQETVLMDRLAQVAKERGFGQQIVEGLDRHKGTLVSWLVEIGFQIAKRAGSN